jgi:hypothetical protein
MGLDFENLLGRNTIGNTDHAEQPKFVQQKLGSVYA